VIAKHAATLKALPFSDVRDFDDAALLSQGQRQC
jgi:hypothetical protein